MATALYVKFQSGIIYYSESVCLYQLTTPLNFVALRNIELASFLRWYVTVELNDPAYAKRFYCTYEILEDNMMKV